MPPVLLASPNTSSTSYVTEGFSIGHREQLAVLAPAASAACCCVHSRLLIVSTENVTLVLAALTYRLPHAAADACMSQQKQEAVRIHMRLYMSVDNSTLLGPWACIDWQG
jgi:hypothetical protein